MASATFAALAGTAVAHDDDGGSGGGSPPGSVALSGVACAGGSAAGFPCRNVDLRAFVPLAQLGVSRLANLWGWTDPVTGIAYALVAGHEGVVFVSLADPDQPVVVGFLASATAASLWGEIDVYADHLFHVKESAGHGLQVFELAQLRGLTGPPVSFAATGHYTGFGNAHNVSVNRASGLGVVVGSNTCAGGLHLLDLTQPTSPAFLGCYSGDGYTHDVQCVSYRGPDLARRGREICFASNVDTLTIVDVTDRANPLQLSRTSYSGVGYVHQGALAAGQRYFVQNDELDEINFGHGTRTHVWDVSDLGAPVWRGFHAHATSAIDHDLLVFGDHVLQANYRAGVRVLRTGDLSRAELGEVAYFDTQPADDAPSFSGVWGVYRFPSGLVVASDIFSGLFVLEPHPELVPQCADGIDNDSDGSFDFSGGPAGQPPDAGCTSAADPSEAADSACGFGPELIPALTLFAAVRGARRRRGSGLARFGSVD